MNRARILVPRHLLVAVLTLTAAAAAAIPLAFAAEPQKGTWLGTGTAAQSAPVQFGRLRAAFEVGGRSGELKVKDFEPQYFFCNGQLSKIPRGVLKDVKVSSKDEFSINETAKNGPITVTLDAEGKFTSKSEGKLKEEFTLKSPPELGGNCSYKVSFTRGVIAH